MTTDFKRVGESIREKRLKARLSQVKLEKISGSGKAVVWQIEVGRTIPIEKTIWRLGASLCFHRREILEFLDSARYQRKNRDKFYKDYAIKSAERFIRKYSV